MDAGRPERRTYGSYHQFLYRYIEYRRLAVYFPAMYDRRRFVPDDPQPWDPVHALWLRDEEHGRQDVPEAGGRRGRRHPAAGRYHGAGRDGRHRQHRRHLAGHRPRRLRRGVLAVARGAARHDHQVFRGHALHQVPGT